MAYVYILECRDKSLYTGWTEDPLSRLARHQAGKGAKYTRSRRPLKMVYLEEVADRGAALRREYAIKQLSRTKKLDLIKSSPPLALVDKEEP